MKQSSIEFLMEKLFDPSSMVDEQLEWFEQAKAMHEEEIMEAYYAYRYGSCSKDYYNETFNTKEK